jgi:hypothetical protein
MLAFVSMTHSITIFPTAFLTAIEMLSLCTSIPKYLVLVIKGVLSGRVELNTQNHTPKGAPFYIASVKEECLAKLILLGEGSLRRALRHYEAHYHEEEITKANAAIPGVSGPQRGVSSGWLPMLLLAEV